MDDPHLVAVPQGVDQGHEEADRLALLEGPSLGDALSEGDALDELHGVPPAPLGLPHVDGRDDAGVAEASGHPGLTPQPRDRAAVRAQLGVQELDGDGAVHGLLDRAVDRPGRTGAEHALQAIARDGRQVVDALGAPTCSTPGGTLRERALPVRRSLGRPRASVLLPVGHARSLVPRGGPVAAALAGKRGGSPPFRTAARRDRQWPRRTAALQRGAPRGLTPRDRR